MRGRPQSAAAIRFIKTYEATAIIAHPYLSLKPDEVREFLPQAKEAGLDAIETHYTTYDEETTKLAIAVAEEFGLKQSGGSDFHGEAKPDIDLGVGRGNLRVPFQFYEDMRSCSCFR